MEIDRIDHVEIVNFEGLNCFDNCVITYLKHYNYPYELLFSKAWQEYKLKYNDENDIYDSIYQYELLEALFGMKLLTKKQHDLKSLILCIQDELVKEKLLMLKLDLYNCYWSSSYQKHHAPHYFWVTGIDENDTLTICDPSYHVSKEVVDMKDLFQYVTQTCIFEKQQQPCMTEFNYQDWVVNNATEVEKALHYLQEWFEEELMGMEQFDEQNTLQIGKRINRYINNRNCFIQFWIRYGKGVLLDDFKNLIADWTTIKNIVFKLGYSRNREKLIQQGSEKMKYVIGQEQHLLSKIKQDIM